MRPESAHPGDRRRQRVDSEPASVEESAAAELNHVTERPAIQAGLGAMKEGRVRSLAEFDREFRQQHNLGPRVYDQRGGDLSGRDE